MKLSPYESLVPKSMIWTDSLPNHWKVMSVKHLFKIGRGRVIAETELADEGRYPVYSSQTLNNGCLGYIDSYDFDCNQLTWTTDGANAGTVFLRKGKHNCTNVCGTLLPWNSDTTNLSFYLHFFQFVTQFHKRPDTNGAKIMNGEMAAIHIAVPPTYEQELIACFLDRETGRLDVLIKKQEKLIELLFERRKAIIIDAVTQGLKANVSKRPTRANWLKEIPSHWDDFPTKRVFRLIVDPASDDNDFELLSIYTDIGVKPRKDLEAKGNKATTTDGYFRVKKNDFIVNKLLAWMGAIGLSAYDGVTSPAYDVLRAIRKIDYRYYDYLFRSGVMFTEFKKYSRGIMDMRLRLYFEEFGQIYIPFPPESEQAEISNYLDREVAKIDYLIEKARQSIELAKEHRIALISAAVTGKIDVREAI